MEIILSVFPKVPWVFIHRQGLEVLQSVLQKPPGWLRSKHRYSKHFSQILNVSQADLESMDHEEYSIRLLEAFCSGAYRQKSPLGIFLNYIDIKNNFITILEKLWHIKLNKKEIEDIRRVEKIYSKDTGKSAEFKLDSEVKRAMANERQIKLVNELIEPVRLNLKS